MSCLWSIYGKREVGRPSRPSGRARNAGVWTGGLTLIDQRIT